MRKDNTVKKDNETFLIIGVFVVTFILIMSTVAIGKGLGIKEFSGNTIAAEVEMTADEKLLAETPLNNYLLFISSEEYTKFQIEAAKMVENLIAEGKSTEEACEEALLWFSDAVYYDRVKFSESYENIADDIEAYEKDYIEYLKETQH